jgi:hypothetical protein
MYMYLVCYLFVLPYILNMVGYNFIIVSQGYLDEFIFMSPEDISENPIIVHNLKFENIDESQLEMGMPGLV